MTGISFLINDFLSVDYLNKIKKFIPKNRDEYLYITQASYNTKQNTSVPTTVHIEPTNECNQTCRMCVHPDMKRDVKKIDDNIALKAINECAKIGVYALHFFFFGEPFMNRKTSGYLKYAKEKKIPLVSLTSNFSTVKKKEINELVDNQVDSLHISFEGIDRKKYKKIRGIDSFNKVKKNISYLLDRKIKFKSQKPWVSLTYVKTTETDKEIDSFISNWQNLVNDIHISPQFDYIGRSELVKNYGVKANANKILGRRKEKRVPCRQLWHRLVVLSNGELVPCSQNIDGELSIGNIKDTTIHEAWNGEKMNKLRAAHIANDYSDYPVCDKCIDWDWSGKVENRSEIELYNE